MLGSPLFGFAVYLLRTGDAARLAEWYAGVLGLPIVRGREPTFDLSLGDVFILELLADKGAPGDGARGLRLVLGSLDLTATKARLSARGAILLADRTGDVVATDPDGNTVAIRQVKPPRSSFLPGCSALAADLSGVCAVQRFCAEPEVVEAFFARLFGNAKSETGAVCLGNGISLECVPGGQAVVPPTAREAARHCFIVRTGDHDAALQAVRRHCPTPVATNVAFNSAVLSYFADPEGQLWGVDERFDPARFQTPRRPFPEDMEILRRLQLREDGTCRQPTS